MKEDQLRSDPDTYPNIKFRGVPIVMVPELTNKFRNVLRSEVYGDSACCGCKFNNKRYTRDDVCAVQDELDDLGLSCYVEKTIFVSRRDFKYYLADAVAARMSDGTEYTPSKPKPQRARRAKDEQPG